MFFFFLLSKTLFFIIFLNPIEFVRKRVFFCFFNELINKFFVFLISKKSNEKLISTQQIKQDHFHTHSGRQKKLYINKIYALIILFHYQFLKLKKKNFKVPNVKFFRPLPLSRES